ncbi:MAG: hypothetical protein AAB074_20640 [Planctomycetota bacterium]
MTLFRKAAALAVAAAALAGCKTPTATLQVRRPPTLELPSVKVLAVDEFEPATKGDDAIARYVRDQFIAAINKEGAIQAMTLAEAKEKSAASGLKIEAILRGRVWADFVHITGLREPVVSSDVVWGTTDKGIKFIAEAHDKLETQTYEVVKAFVSIQLNLVQVSGVESKTIAALSGGRGYRERIGGGAFSNFNLWTGKAEASAGKADRNRESLLRVSADRAIGEFVKAISPHQETINAVIAKGGDATAASMIRSGQYNQAIQRLEPGLKSAGKDRAPDLHNLGLAYEATGDPALLEAAVFFYRKALEFDPENEDYATGIGRVEQLMRGNARLGGGIQ